jgi:hypothetical protein
VVVEAVIGPSMSAVVDSDHDLLGDCGANRDGSGNFQFSQAGADAVEAVGHYGGLVCDQCTGDGRKLALKEAGKVGSAEANQDDDGSNRQEELGLMAHDVALLLDRTFVARLATVVDGLLNGAGDQDRVARAADAAGRDVVGLLGDGGADVGTAVAVGAVDDGRSRGRFHSEYDDQEYWNLY